MGLLLFVAFVVIFQKIVSFYNKQITIGKDGVMDTLYRSWQLSGWLYHDIFVIIVAIIFIVISGILVISLIRRRSTRRLVPYALILLVYLAVVHFAGLIFFGMFRSVTIEEKSATFYSENERLNFNRANDYSKWTNEWH